jgi:DNA polymerase-3 subunit gamma/tau
MEIIAQLEKIVAAEKIEVDREVLFAVARSSDGSLRDAESILDQLVSFSKDKVSLKDVISVLGLIEQEVLFEITDKIIQKDALAALTLLNEIIDEGKDTAMFLSNLIEHFRNLMVAKIAKADSKLIDLPQEICERLLKQAHEFTLEEIFSAFNIMVNTQEVSKRLDSARIPLEISLVKLTHDKKSAHLNPPSEKNIHGDKGPALENKPAPKHTEHIPENLNEARPEKHEIKKDDAPAQNIHSAQSISLDAVKDAWQNIITSLGSIKISAATYLNEGMPVGIERNILTVAFPKDYSLHKESLERKENKTIIEKTISELFNTNLRVNFTLSKEDAPKLENEDGFLRSALQMFKGRVIKS